MSPVSDILVEVWRALGSEILIFAATLAFALAIRAFNGAGVGRPAVAGKGASFGKDRPSAPKVAPGQPRQPQLARVASGGCRPSSDSSGSSSPRSSPRCEGVEPFRKPTTAAPVAPRRPPSPRARTPIALVNEIMEGMEKQLNLRFFTRSLQVYRDEIRKTFAKEGMNIKDVIRQTRHTPINFYTALVHYAIRTGWYNLVEELLDDMVQQGVTRPLNFYESAMKQLAGQKQYHLALAVYDRLERDGLRPSAVTCSCLVSFAVEVGELQRALVFFEKLSATTTPSIRAYMTVLRVHARRQDFKASVAIFQDMERRRAGVDSLALNVVLATGVAADQLEAVDELVRQADARQPPITDVISYNTLLKALAQRCDAQGAQEVLVRMNARGLAANHITYNTAMDACVRAGKLAEAWPLVDTMRKQGLSPDKFTASIIVKGLSRSPSTCQVKQALALLRETDSVCDGALKVSLYHAVFEAARHAVDANGDLAIVARTFTQMRQYNVAPSQAVQRFMMHALPSASS